MCAVAAAVALLGSFYVPVAEAAPSIGQQFTPGSLLSGAAWDQSTSNLFIYTDWSSTITEYTPDGTSVGTIPMPGPTTYHIDLDVTTAPMNVGGTPVPGGTLLVFTNATLYAVDPDTGGLLDSVSVSMNSLNVGVAQYPERGTVFLLDNGARVREIDPATGGVLNEFPLPVPAGGDAMFISRGDIEVHPETGNLVAGGTRTYLREMTPQGDFVRDIDLSHLSGVDALSGLAFDDSADLWITTGSDDGVNNDHVFKIVGLDSASSGPPECQKAGSICTGSDDDQVEGTTSADFIFSGDGDDVVNSSAGDDTVLAGGGSDQVAAGQGSDKVDGGAGVDRIWGDRATAPARAANGPSSDVLKGGGGGDFIFGEAGNDLLDGGGGNDILKGGPGVNILKGGPGKDTCYGDKKDKYRSCERLRRHI